MRLLPYLSAPIVAFLLGILAAQTGILNPMKRTASNHRPAYLLASWKVLSPDKLKPFDEAIAPLVRKAQMKVLAGDPSPVVLEGTWPYKGNLVLERYDSMKTLLDLWRSPENTAAQKLRAGFVDSEFIVAFEASSAPEKH